MNELNSLLYDTIRRHDGLHAPAKQSANKQRHVQYATVIVKPTKSLIVKFQVKSSSLLMQHDIRTLLHERRKLKKKTLKT